MNRRHRHRRPVDFAALGAACIALGLTGCDDEPDLPPEEKPAIRPVEIDINHSARVKADRTYTIANLVLVLQPDRSGGKQMGITLTTSRIASDGARLIFGTFEQAGAIEDLVNRDIEFVGTAAYNPQGNGIFSPFAVYQPKLAQLRITSLEKEEAAGTIIGEFYRQQPAQPTLHPPVTNIETTFSAKLIVR